MAATKARQKIKRDWHHQHSWHFHVNTGLELENIQHLASQTVGSAKELLGYWYPNYSDCIPLLTCSALKMTIIILTIGITRAGLDTATMVENLTNTVYM